MIKTNAIRIIEKLNIPYQLYEYNPDKGVDANSVAKYLNKSEEQVFKTLVTESQNTQHSYDYFVFVIPANCTLNLKKASLLAGVKDLSMIPQKKLQPLTGYIHGGCSPVGMRKAFPTFIDETALLFDSFCVSGGKVGLTLELSAQQLATAIDAKFGDLT